MIETLEEVDYIKIPKDFKSLHDLKELMGNYDLASRLTNALNGYQRAFVASYLMTMDEVLKYIPKDQWESYTVMVREDEKYEYVYPRKTKKEPWPDGKKSTDITKMMLKVEPKKKIFLVDTIKKTIDTCGWGIWMGEKMPVLKKKKKKTYSYDDEDYGYDEVTHKPNIEYHVNTKKRELIVHAPYSYTTSQAIGGVWINGRANGYLSGHKYVDYTIGGYDIYKFCTRTNKYIGYGGHSEEPKRGWMDV